MATPHLLRRTFKTRTREVGFQVLCGSAQTLLPSLAAGATGGVLAMASFAPQACAEIYMAWKDRDATLAEEKQQRIVEAADVVCGRMGIPGVKYACDLNGYYGGSPRLPLLPLTAAERDRGRSSAGGHSPLTQGSFATFQRRTAPTQP